MTSHSLLKPVKTYGFVRVPPAIHVICYKNKATPKLTNPGLTLQVVEQQTYWEYNPADSDQAFDPHISGSRHSRTRSTGGSQRMPQQHWLWVNITQPTNG